MKSNETTKLRRAFLDKSKTLIKTKQGNLYGMWNIQMEKEIIPPSFLHIFRFNEFDEDMTIAIKPDKTYVGLDRLGVVLDIPDNLKTRYQTYIIKGDSCNCKTGCGYCEWTGMVDNQFGLNYNFRFWRSYDDFDDESGY